MSEPANGLMLCDDLIFFSRVSGTARAAGLSVAQFRTASALLEAARRHRPGGVLLDLQHEGLDLPRFLADLHGIGSPPPKVVAFGSHVEAETLRAAQEAGCDLVLPRSKFVKLLETDLKAWLGQDD